MNLRPHKLVILLQDLEFGGTQRYALNLLRYLDRNLFSPELWVLRRGADMASSAIDAGIKVVWLSRLPWVTPLALINLLVRLIVCRPRILYTLTVVPNIWGRLFGRAAGVPAIVSGYRGLFPRQHERWLWPLSRRIICNAEALKDIMCRRLAVDSDRISVIPNGVDTEFFSPKERREANVPTVVFIGRFVEEKAPLDLLKAFEEMIKKLPAARLEMVGKGPLYNKLKEYVRSKSLESRVRLIPATGEIMPFLNRAWIFAIASVKEASPNVIIEAMSVGLPVVATRVGGIPELVIDGETGILVEPGKPRDIGSALLGLLTDRPRRQAMGLRARQRVLDMYTLGNMVRHTEKMLIEAMDDGNY